ncbi:hypothetical protein [Candidatus Protofrankia datiscae]|uniref:hypothetical protein n=1 Tax=Candidatus Protofrankia datiscae TaxID=2716812 RepID=UPI0001C530F9|nr:hypothetical protein [Candidatus Protofrankia datiscae]
MDNSSRLYHKHFGNSFRFGSSWINQIETWFETIARRSIRRGTFMSVKVLIKWIWDYISYRNAKHEPFVLTATADGILARVRIIRTGIKKVVDNNGT